MKVRKQLSLLTLLIFTFTALGGNFSCNAETKNTEKYDLIIACKDNTIDQELENKVEDEGGEVVKEIPELGEFEVKCSPKLITQIKENENVETVAGNTIIKMQELQNENSYYNDNSNGYYKDNSDGYYKENNNGYYKDSFYNLYQWDIKRVTNNGASYYLEHGNHDVVVGIVDSGVDIDHPDLKDNFLGGKNLVPKGFAGDDTESGDISDVGDRYGHGTMVTGEIAANGKVKGVAPNIGFKSYRIFDKLGRSSTAIITDAITKAVDDGVKVINLSIGMYVTDGSKYYIDPESGEVTDLGSNYDSYVLLKKAIDYAEKNNVVVVTASGNDGVDCSDNKKLTEEINELSKIRNIFYSGNLYLVPAVFPNVINVSCTKRDDALSSFSNYGQGFIGVSAPGGEIMKDDKGEYVLNELNLTTASDGGYAFNAGTSLAAPKVSAEAGLILCKYKNLTPAQVKNKIYSTADKKDNENYYGAGIINVYNALK